MKKQFFLLGICLSLMAASPKANAQDLAYASNQASTTQSLSDEQQPASSESSSNQYFNNLTSPRYGMRINATKANGAYEEGSNFVNLGFGVGTYYGSGVAFGASYEYGFTDAISGGAFLGYSGSTGFGYRYSFLYFGARAAYHFMDLFGIDNDQLDLYGGASLGYRSYSDNIDGNNTYWDYGSGVVIGPFAGARYMFSPNVGAFGEVGYGVAALQAGITFKF